MIDILLVEDNAEKIQAIKVALLEISDIKDSNIYVSADINTAKERLEEKQFDLLILDLLLPLRYGDTPDKNNGIAFLDDISIDSTYHAPFHIIGLTAYEELTSTFKDDFSSRLWYLIHFDETYSKWSDQLKGYVKYLVRSKSEILNSNSVEYTYDLAIVTALASIELENILRLKADWQEFRISNDHTIYSKGIFQDGAKRLTVVAASADQMGMVSTSILCQKMIFNFRPKHIIMAGIAAGIKEKGNFGDIMIADLTWDYGSGKIASDAQGNYKFKQDPRPVPIDPGLGAIIKNEVMKDSFTDKISRNWTRNNGEDFGKLKALHGPIASGSYVIENYLKVQEVNAQQRKLIGIDMETYAVFYVCMSSSEPKPKAMSIKSICDYGDNEKSDKYQKYAGYTSASYVFEFALKYL